MTASRIAYTHDSLVIGHDPAVASRNPQNYDAASKAAETFAAAIRQAIAAAATTHAWALYELLSKLVYEEPVRECRPVSRRLQRAPEKPQTLSHDSRQTAAIQSATGATLPPKGNANP